MAGEASGNLRSWQKVKGKQAPPSQVARERESVQGKLPLLKPSDLMRTPSLPQEQHGGNHTYDSITSHQVPSMTREDYGITIQDEIWVETQSETLSPPQQEGQERRQ